MGCGKVPQGQREDALFVRGRQSARIEGTRVRMHLATRGGGPHAPLPLAGTLSSTMACATGHAHPWPSWQRLACCFSTIFWQEAFVTVPIGLQRWPQRPGRDRRHGTHLWVFCPPSPRCWASQRADAARQHRAMPRHTRVQEPLDARARTRERTLHRTHT